MADHVGEGDGGVLVGGSAVLVETEGGDAAGVDDARHPGGQGGFHELAGALDIDAVDGVGIGDPDAVVGGDVIERLAAGEGGFEGGAVGEVALGDLHGEAVEIAAIVVAAGQHPHPSAGGEQMAGDRGADEAGGAGYQGGSVRQEFSLYFN